ncbi:cbb3-type cytochrome oxidase subunit 3 [Bdellovibrio reynosensis]|uniref:Cbb3-type cytochrome c oxidase subunit 3 n=1 Tax=Bdellovibrio reynosensis TaxID=2835041 RepID=A0ABY4CA02_9BACT|nr:CcoQ/FixQ family Cbb3-type cytochrome c oxidase assembly chaperone [Bdellovibrio reynosensis]UOF01569.1 cbb3-type cytochrome c oxidase subunit 3 [Bdellovibrio reynosensis]
MKQEALKYFTDTHLTAMGLVIFFLFFAGVVAWVYRKHSKEIYAHLEQLPLKGGE